MFDFKKSYDVAVAGAGVAGITAAVAAARMGKKVVLIEKQAITGGLATSGMIFIYLPLCDGKGRQVTFGLAEELLFESLKFSPCRLDKKWGGEGGEGVRERMAAPFSPAGMVVAAEKMLADAGVDLWYDTLICKTVLEGSRVTALEVENVSGRGLIESSCFVDATGDAGILRRAGAEIVPGHNTNGSTLWFMAGNPDADRKYPLGSGVNIQTIPVLKGIDLDDRSTLSGKGVTEFQRMSHRVINEHYAALYAENPGDRFKYYPLFLPGMPLFRKIAHIVSRTPVNGGDFNRRFEDSVGLVGDWRTPGKIWETPYGSLLPEKFEGVLAAGRSMGSYDDAWEAFRVIPAAAMTGEAAGTAAALSLENGCLPSELDVALLRKKLAENKFIFHISDLQPIETEAVSEVYTEE